MRESNSYFLNWTLKVHSVSKSMINSKSFSDMFALNVGRTKLKHSVDKGGQGPVKQLSYSTLFSLQSKMEMIKESRG